MHVSRAAGIAMIVVGVIFLVLAVGVLYFVLAPSNVPADPGQPAPQTNPFGALGSGSLSGDEGRLELGLSDGTKVAVPDFTQGEQPVWVSEYEYQVSGAPTDTYLITFLEPDQDNPQGEFLVTLLAEPLGDTRKAAEAALIERLGISRQELCKLDANVAVGPGVNDLYPPDYDLEFDSCPGAVVLP